MHYGDKVKDINPQCAHYGAEGKVVGTKPNKVIFIVTNKGKTYKPGDKLEKTNDQMKKTSSLVITDAAKQELEKVGFMAAVTKGVKAVGRGAKKTLKVTAVGAGVGTAGYVAGKAKEKEQQKQKNMGYPNNRYYK